MQIKFDAVSYLKEHDIKPSVQRIAIVNYLYAHRMHPTAEDVFAALLPQIPTLSRTTVYNTLNLFVEHDAVQMLNINAKSVHYDIDMQKHAHFCCTTCGRLFDLFADSVKVPEVHLPDDFVGNSVQLYITGVCAECNKKTTSSINTNN